MCLNTHTHAHVHNVRNKGNVNAICFRIDTSIHIGFSEVWYGVVKIT